MEVHDFDEEHLKAVLKDDGDEDAPDESATARSTVPSRGRPISPVTSAAQSDGRTEDDEKLLSEQYHSLPEYAKPSFNGEVKDRSINEEDERNFHTQQDSGIAQAQSTHLAEEPFSLTEEEQLLIPDGTATPLTKRQNEIMKMAAARAATAPQFEVLLKLKQSDNPDFMFLQSGHELHRYYLLLKEGNGKIISTARSAASPNRDAPSTSGEKGGVGVMSGLLGIYSSSSDDDEEDDNESAAKAEKGALTSSPVEDTNPLLHLRTAASDSEGRTAGEKDTFVSNETTVGGNNIPVDTKHRSSSADDQRKAKMLKRAKMMKGHFALKLMDNSK